MSCPRSRQGHKACSGEVDAEKEKGSCAQAAVRLRYTCWLLRWGASEAAQRVPVSSIRQQAGSRNCSAVGGKIGQIGQGGPVRDARGLVKHKGGVVCSKHKGMKERGIPGRQSWVVCAESIEPRPLLFPWSTTAQEPFCGGLTAPEPAAAAAPCLLH